MLLLNGQKIKAEQFPNGETKINGTLLDLMSKDTNLITMRFESDLDLMSLMYVKNHLDNLGKGNDVTLSMPYIPYSRMDRTEGTAVFTLKMVAHFINGLNFTQVEVFESHSDVSLALIDRVKSFTMADIGMIERVMEDIGFDKEKDFILYPDAGAEKRYKGILKGNSLLGLKHRNFETQRIESFQLVGKTKPEDTFNKVIILDDMSSFGGTFLLGAEALFEEYGFQEVYLVVGHAEDKIIEGGMINSGLVKKIYTTDSLLTVKDDRIEMYDYFNMKQYTEYAEQPVA